MKTNRIKRNRNQVEHNIFIILISLLLLIGISSKLCTFAYFTDEANAEVDLIITPGTLSTYITKGIDSDILPGETTESNEFNIVNSGTLNQNINLKYTCLSDILNEDLRDITYELLLKDKDNSYITLLDTNIEDLKNTNLKLFIPNNSHLDFISKIHVSEEISSDSYEKILNLKLNVTGSQTNDHNNNYYKAKAYQDNTIKVITPEINEIPKHSFSTSVIINNTAINALSIDIKELLAIYDVSKISITDKKGVFENKGYYVRVDKYRYVLNITLQEGNYIYLEEIDSERPSSDILEIEVEYMLNNEKLIKNYIIEFIRGEESDTSLEAYFYEV